MISHMCWSCSMSSMTVLLWKTSEMLSNAPFPPPPSPPPNPGCRLLLGLRLEKFFIVLWKGSAFLFWGGVGGSKPNKEAFLVIKTEFPDYPLQTSSTWLVVNPTPPFLELCSLHIVNHSPKEIDWFFKSHRVADLGRCLCFSLLPVAFSSNPLNGQMQQLCKSTQQAFNWD